MIAKKSHDDDLLEDLPPLDGEAGEEEKVDVGEERLDASLDEGDPFDDEATGASAGGEEIEASEGDALSFAETSEDVDVGGSDFMTEEDVPRGDFEPADTTDVSGDEMKEEAWEKDDGEEGPTREEDLLAGSELPAIDEDDDSEVDDAALFDPGMLRESERSLSWDDKIWERLSELSPQDGAEEDLDGSLVPNLPSEGRVLAVAFRGDRTAVVVEDEGVYLSSEDGAWEFVTETERATAVTFVGELPVIALRKGGGALVAVFRESGLRKVAELGDDEGAITHLLWNGREVHARTPSKTAVFRVT